MNHNIGLLPLQIKLFVKDLRKITRSVTQFTTPSKSSRTRSRRMVVLYIGPLHDGSGSSDDNPYTYTMSSKLYLNIIVP